MITSMAMAGRTGRTVLAACRRSMFATLACLALIISGSPAMAEESAPLQQIYLYRSARTAAFFKANDSDYGALLVQWRTYLKRRASKASEIGYKDLLAGPKPGVLILPSTLLLGDDERAAIQSFMQRGGSVLASWGTGARDGNGKWRGYGFVEKQFDLKIVGEIERDSEQWFMMPFGDGPLTWPIPAGRRMFLGKVAENLLRIDSRRVAARYMNWDRAPDFEGEQGAIGYAEMEGARRVYFGFSESAWDYHKRDDINQMLDAVMSWLMREPRTWMAAWPDGKTAAQLLEMDTEDRFENAVHFAQALEASGIRGTFYCLTSEAIKNPDLVRRLRRQGHEIAYHAETHTGFGDQPPAHQEQRLQLMLEQMASVLGPDLSELTGFRAPTESYDRATEVLLRRYGMRHHAADPNATEDRLPFFSKAEPALGPEDALVVLPRTNYDDISFRKMEFSQEKVTMHLLHDFDYAIEAGALGLLSVHSQNYGPDGSMMVGMPAVFDRVAKLKDKVWFARGDAIAAWWRSRARVQATVSRDAASGNNIIDVVVKPSGNVNGLSFMTTNAVVDKPPAQVTALTRNAPIARIVPIDGFRSAIVVAAASPGTYRYLVRY
ncbi:polysaccharide deacetylase family protein [Noviherbaspirillum galbum]|uniref:Polysaccharide deacetylase family protein n=1 Tax=Noviherbaspirillum galbum TaxID=2709383 RepID=A0A6B3SLL9_9BURK|nr:polysaccharide deacetylase family protein [Noviherbaspirillum galbum]NEX59536.1 polysaccharide deacetylase family protein [Noviherbaspirillum galbum]